jgi:hypothetical protein
LEGQPVNAATVVAIADNNTTKQSQTDQSGIARLEITTRRKYQLLVAHPRYPGSIVPAWDPGDDLRIVVSAGENTGSMICHGTGYIPGLEGRLNPIMDSHLSMYLYADNIAINGGKQQPAHFDIDSPFELEDSNGVIMQVRVLHIQGKTSLIQFAHAPSGDVYR